ncbi:MAG: MFS transporter [Acidobacteriia bacterium]|nr:MFS transporter [Terriglobia bacterium]
MSSTEPAIALGLRAPLAVGNFRKLWIGEVISVLGDQFYFVAMPWLVLQLAGSGLALGSVLMTVAIPSASLMLLGGAITDRFSPRMIMLISNLVRAMIVSVLAALVFAHSARMWHLYVFAAIFGTVDGFCYPADAAMVPSLLEPTLLTAGNSLMQGSYRFLGLIGPVTAGIIIGKTGLGPAFVVDAISFFVAVAMLAALTPNDAPVASREQPLIASIREGISYTLAHPIIRSLLLVFAVTSLSLSGPFFVGVPLLARQRFTRPSALGLLYSSFGAGTLLGITLAGQVQRKLRIGPILMGVYVASGIAMIAISLLWHIWTTAIVLFLMGIAVGYANIVNLSYLQRQTEASKMGRVMSLVMFCAQGLAPLAYLGAGALSKLGTTVLFFSSGISTIVVACVLFRAPHFWRKKSPLPSDMD